MLGGVTRSVDGVDRALSRLRRMSAQIQIERHVARRLLSDDDDGADTTAGRHEVPDHVQLRGAGVIVIRSPAWPREDWAEPQRRRVRRPR